MYKHYSVLLSIDRCASADDVLFTRASEDDVSSPVNGISPVRGKQITSSRSGSSISRSSRGSYEPRTTKSTDGNTVHERVSDIMNLATVGSKVPDESTQPRITVENGIGKECGHSGSPTECNTVASGIQPTQQVPVQYKTPTRVYKVYICAHIRMYVDVISPLERIHFLCLRRQYKLHYPDWPLADLSVPNWSINHHIRGGGDPRDP